METAWITIAAITSHRNREIAPLPSSVIWQLPQNQGVRRQQPSAVVPRFTGRIDGKDGTGRLTRYFVAHAAEDFSPDPAPFSGCHDDQVALFLARNTNSLFHNVAHDDKSREFDRTRSLRINVPRQEVLKHQISVPQLHVDEITLSLADRKPGP